MNWISLFVVGVFTLDMMVKTWVCAFKPEWYLEYVAQQNREITPNEERQTEA